MEAAAASRRPVASDARSVGDRRLMGVRRGW
jgi:hypothetical protein